MKIAIYTQTLGKNYGGILQNYALQQTLKRMGHTPVTIYLGRYDYITYLKCVVHNLMRIYTKQKYWNVLSPIKIKREEAPFTPFVRKHIVTTKRIGRCCMRFFVSQKFDAVIVGSDQVWRPQYNNIYDSFLSFVETLNILKLSYAASFGIDEWEFSSEQTNVCRNLIKQFKAVSVREDSGVNLCKKYLNVDAVEVLDPTLLLSRDDYNLLCQDIPPYEVPNLVAYVLDMTDETMDYIDETARNKGLKIRCFTADAKSTLTVAQWIASFRDADFVITDSFHGTVFSLIYQKNFFSLVNNSRGASRFYSLLSKFELKNRTITGYSHQVQEINWEKVNSSIEQLQTASLNFLKRSLGSE